MLNPSSPSSSDMKVKTEPVNRVQAKGVGVKSELTCHRCGAPGHLARQCKFKDSVCNKCGKTGHLARVCQSKPPTNAFKFTKPRRESSQPVWQVEDETDTESDDPVLPDD